MGLFNIHRPPEFPLSDSVAHEEKGAREESDEDEEAEDEDEDPYLVNPNHRTVMDSEDEESSESGEEEEEEEEED